MKSEGLKISSENILIGLFVINVIVSMLASFSLYQFPGMTSILMLLLIITYIIVSKSKGMLSVDFRDAKIFGVTWALVYLLSALTSSRIPGLGLWVSLLYGVLFLCLKEGKQEKILHAYVWTLSVLLCFSIVEYGIYQATGRGIVLGNTYRST